MWICLKIVKISFILSTSEIIGFVSGKVVIMIQHQILVTNF